MAESTVEEHRQYRRGQGFVIGDHDAWSVEEIALAAEVWIPLLGRFLRWFQDAGLKLAQVLWPGAVMPDTTTRVARWLEAAPERLEAWKASAARAGAQMALSFVLSWYPDVELGQLATRRAEPDLEPHAGAIGVRTSDLASYVDLNAFVRERVEDGTELPEDTFGLPLNGEEVEDSEEETGASSEGDGPSPPTDEANATTSADPKAAAPRGRPAGGLGARSICSFAFA